MPFSSNSIHQDLLAWPSEDVSNGDPGFLFYARSFGSDLTDMDLDLSAQPRPYIVTQLLHTCLVDTQRRHFTVDDIWYWSVKRRLQGVLAIAAATLGTNFNLTAHCTHPSCDEKLEIELQLHDFISTDDEIEIHCEPESGTDLTLRLPTGRDQLSLRHSVSATDFGATLRYMGRALISQCNGQEVSDNFPLPDSWLEAIDESLMEADALTALSLETKCPFCDADNEVELDLECSLLELLAARQHSLLDDIHLLASAYHWSEEQVVRLPALRRSFYIERITGGGQR